VVSLRAMDLAIEKARVTGIGAVGVFNSNHFGEAAHYVIRAAERNMIGVIATNGSPNMPALGGTTKMTGPLPFTAAVPTGIGPPFVIDAALGVTNRGKLIYLAERGERIPLGWGVDRDARSTDLRCIAGLFRECQSERGVELRLGITPGWGLHSADSPRYTIEPERRHALVLAIQPL